MKKQKLDIGSIVFYLVFLFLFLLSIFSVLYGIICGYKNVVFLQAKAEYNKTSDIVIKQQRDEKEVSIYTHYYDYNLSGKTYEYVKKSDNKNPDKIITIYYNPYDPTDINVSDGSIYFVSGFIGSMMILLAYINMRNRNKKICNFLEKLTITHKSNINSIILKIDVFVFLISTYYAVINTGKMINNNGSNIMLISIFIPISLLSLTVLIITINNIRKLPLKEKKSRHKKGK